MDREHAAITLAAHFDGTLAQRHEVTEIGVNRLHRNHFGSHCTEQAQATREFVGESELTLEILVALRTKRICQIFRAPGHGSQPRQAAVIAGSEHCRGGFGHQRNDRRAAGLDAVFLLERAHHAVELLDIMAAPRFGQHDPARPGGHDGGKIIGRPLSVERVDPHPQAGALLGALPGKEFGNRRSGIGLAAFDHRIFEIEDDDVGVAFGRLEHFLAAVAGGEQPAAHADSGFGYRVHARA